MATGILGTSDLASTTNTTVYTVPAAKIATFSVNIVNRNTTPVTIRVALAASATPAASEYIEYETPLLGYGVLERTGLLLDATKQLVAYSSAANVSINVYGFEE